MLPLVQGDLVWAQLGARQRWWPAVIITAHDCGRSAVKDGHVWVFWFGDYKVSEVCFGLSLYQASLCVFVQVVYFAKAAP